MHSGGFRTSDPQRNALGQSTEMSPLVSMFLRTFLNPLKFLMKIFNILVPYYNHVEILIHIQHTQPGLADSILYSAHLVIYLLQHLLMHPIDSLINKSVATLTHRIFRGSEVLNPLQSGPEFTPWDLELLILEECDG